MALELTLVKARELVERAIEEKGSDYIYEKHDGDTCLYVHDLEPHNEPFEPTPGCIVGCALILGGLDVDDFAGINMMPAPVALERLQADGLVNTSGEVMSYLEILQTNQDRGKTWGEANERALQGFIWRTKPPYYIESQGEWIKDGA